MTCGRLTLYQEAMEKVAQVSMADLIGYSEPPEGMQDQYPFNALAWVKALRAEWQPDAHRIVVYVYHEEKMPAFSILPD